METENLMALTYGGDLMQYKPIWYADYKVCGAGVNLPGDEAVMGRWAESWKSSADGLTWTFNLKKGIKSEAGNEMTCEDHRWSWERGFEMKGVQGVLRPGHGARRAPRTSTCPDKHTVQFKIKAANPLILKLMAMNYYGGPFDATEAKKHATAADPWAKEWLKSQRRRLRPLQDRPQHPRPGDGARRATRTTSRGRRWGASSSRSSRTRRRGWRCSSAARSTSPCGCREREYQEVAKDPNLQVVAPRRQLHPLLRAGPDQPDHGQTKVRQALAYAMPYEEIHQKVYSGQGQPDQEHHAGDLPELHRAVLAVQDRSRRRRRALLERGRVPERVRPDRLLRQGDRRDGGGGVLIKSRLRQGRHQAPSSKACRPPSIRRPSSPRS